MTKEIIKNILPTLNKDAFLQYLIEFWKIDDFSDGIHYRKTTKSQKIGNNIFEQHYWTKEKIDGLYIHQGHNLIIPFFQPIELLENITETQMIFDELSSTLHKYKHLIKDRERYWQYWTDGIYCNPYIKFMTNLEGIEPNIYSEQIIPLLETVLEKYDIPADVAIGSCDSLLELQSTKAIRAFENFLKTYKKQISISLVNGKPTIDHFISNKYITNGLLKNDLSPYEPIYVEHTSKSDIIKEFEFLLQCNPSESTLESFLKQHYQDVFGSDYNRIETQLWLHFKELDINSKDRRIDIFLRNSISQDWELFEIKNTKKIIKPYRDLPAFTSQICNAIQQIKHYEHILLQDSIKQQFAKKGIEYYHPELRLVAGMKPDISIAQWRYLQSTQNFNPKIITFDELLDAMKTRIATYQSISSY